MLRVGDYVTGVSWFGKTVTGRVTTVSQVSVWVNDGDMERCCFLRDVHKTDPPIPNEDVMLDEFDSAHIKENGVTVAIRNRGPVMDKVDGGMRFKPLDGPAETHFSDGTVIPDEFDEGGLKKMPDGTLESVHIPTEKEAMIPYTATGTGGPPKPKPPVLEWKVEKARDDGEYIVYLMVDGKQHGVRNTYNCRGWFRSVRGRIAEAKKQLMSAYEICLKESGRVE